MLAVVVQVLVVIVKVLVKGNCSRCTDVGKGVGGRCQGVGEGVGSRRKRVGKVVGCGLSVVKVLVVGFSL